MKCRFHFCKLLPPLGFFFFSSNKQPINFLATDIHPLEIQLWWAFLALFFFKNQFLKAKIGEGIGYCFFLKRSTKTIKNTLCEDLCWRFAMITPLKLWPHQEMQQKMPAIPRSFVASRAGSYPSALRSWLCRVTLRPGELIHRKSGDICAMVGCVWNRNNLSIFFDTSQVVGDHWISESPLLQKWPKPSPGSWEQFHPGEFTCRARYADQDHPCASIPGLRQQRMCQKKRIPGEYARKEPRKVRC